MNTLTMILQLIPALIAAIKAIEEAIPGTGEGEKKLAAVRGIIEIVDASSKAVWPAIAGTISVLVKLMNDTGVFKKP